MVNRSNDASSKAQCATFPYPNDVNYWRARALEAQAKLAVLEAQSESGRGDTAKEIDVERLLDNAATASQERQLLRNDDDEETPLREAVRLSVAEPLLRALRSNGGCTESEQRIPIYDKNGEIAGYEEHGPTEKEETAELRSALDRRDESLITRILNLRAKADRLERELAAVHERLDWTVEDNAKKAIEIADLKAAQSAIGAADRLEQIADDLGDIATLDPLNRADLLLKKARQLRSIARTSAPVERTRNAD